MLNLVISIILFRNKVGQDTGTGLPFWEMVFFSFIHIKEGRRGEEAGRGKNGVKGVEEEKLERQREMEREKT